MDTFQFPFIGNIKVGSSFAGMNVVITIVELRVAMWKFTVSNEPRTVRSINCIKYSSEGQIPHPRSAQKTTGEVG